MQAYKAQLRRQLAEHGWEVTEVSHSDDWWAEVAANRPRGLDKFRSPSET
jgi:hypothetical protein